MLDAIYSIYRITNILNNKVYIGQSKDPKTRWSRHKSDARLGKKYNYHLYTAMRKYGIENFIFEVILQTKIMEEIDQLEIDCINQYKSSDRNIGYNISAGGQANRIVSSETRLKLSKAATGRIISEATRSILSIMHKGKKHTEETKKNISIFHTGKHLSEKTKKKLSQINTGKKATEETKNKRSQSMIGKNAGENNGMFGKRPSHAKLTQIQADEIRQEYFNIRTSCIKLAKKFNVSKKTILNIIHDKIYIKR